MNYAYEIITFLIKISLSNRTLIQLLILSISFSLIWAVTNYLWWAILQNLLYFTQIVNDNIPTERWPFWCPVFPTWIISLTFSFHPSHSSIQSILTENTQTAHITPPFKHAYKTKSTAHPYSSFLNYYILYGHF